ncbi:thioredoxin [Mycobacterium phage LittleE]|uniref:Glutaredoxin domain-containing protein n=5 Tax=Omegavirus TaxID=1623292 RepID=Q854K8_BPMOM|nr:thioredoxin domain [Mycobacterium phage Omega]YP_009011950.1 thioredoxin domain [Mycobacterium phage Courthouse]YP_009018056.1 thioredoxin domain [Mycobacterium phage Thibault]YP_009205181.1 thioredoxin domain [Mycobacterium phage Ariel]YP_009213268.1 thioredoxin domain [Mycobacterium phage MiaZeal]YP_009636967.1 thioredoxin domain [Mycobacterium phage LittleE]ASD50848.1 thioredoxin [Mycobacterium phage Porcelain]ASD53444.1 thioredoxin [Mycobacterium phage Lucky2013]ATS92894.1 thioredoxi
MYSPPTPCVMCRTTKARLDKFGIPYESVVTDEETANRFRNEGRSSYPVVVVERDGQEPWVWSGFRDTEIKKLADELASK